MSAERNVIGALLLPTADAWPEVRGVLTGEDFGEPLLAAAWQAIADLHEGERPVDAITVADELAARDRASGTDYGTGALADLGRMARDVGSAANIRAYADIVLAESRRRGAVRIARELSSAVQSEAGLEAVDVAVRSLLSLRDGGDSTTGAALRDALPGVLAELDSDAPTGLSTGLRDLDRVLGGLMGGDLVVVGARPAMGKTAFACNLALATDSAVGIVSSEQPTRQIAARLLSIDSGVSLHRMRTRRLHGDDWPRLTSSSARLQSRRIHIADRSQPDVAEVERQARAWRYHHGIEALYVDYLQHLRAPRHDRRHEEVAAIARALKRIARDLGIPVVALAQVKRDVEQRSNKRPLIGDLLESGAIEQEADQILLLYRDEVYSPETRATGVCEIDVAKNRHGPTGAVTVQWDGEALRFRDLARTAWHAA